MIKLIAIDMDGTFYLGDTLLPGALAFWELCQERGLGRAFLTNNSSKSVDAYIAKLGRMGISAVREDFLTSVDALIADLRRGPGYRKCYAFGTESFRDQLREAG